MQGEGDGTACAVVNQLKSWPLTTAHPGTTSFSLCRDFADWTVSSPLIILIVQQNSQRSWIVHIFGILTYYANVGSTVGA